MFAEHDSDSDSELSLDEHSSSYASSHSSDSEEDGLDTEKKWNTSTSKNNERGPLHSTPKGTPKCKARAMGYSLLYNIFGVDGTNSPDYYTSETASPPLCLASAETLIVSSFDIFLPPKGLFTGGGWAQVKGCLSKSVTHSTQAKWAFQAGSHSTWK